MNHATYNPLLHYRPLKKATPTVIRTATPTKIVDLSACMNRPKSPVQNIYTPPTGIIDISDVRFNKKIKGLSHEKI